MYYQNIIRKVVHKDVLNERQKIIEQKKNKWYTYSRDLYTTFVTKLKLKLPELNHTAETKSKCHLKLLNYDFILGRDIVNELGK